MSFASLDVPELVRQRAMSNGAAGRRWLDDLPEVVASLCDRWGLDLENTFRGGTASFVAAATDRAGRACVLKVAMPLDMDETATFARSVLVHQLAEGRGCARLLDHDDTAPAMLLERLGPNLAELGMPLPQLLETIAMTLRSFWRPVAEDCGLPTGADKAAWLAGYITTTWQQLGRPCGREVIDRALAYCDERAAAFDSAQAVLVHGDAHGWNTLDAGAGGFKFVDPEGVRSEPAHDLGVPMREYNEELLAGDTARLVRARAERLAPAAVSIPSRSGSGASSNESRPASPTSATSLVTTGWPSSRSPHAVSDQCNRRRAVSRGLRDRRGISPICRAHRWSYVRRVRTIRAHPAIALLLAAGLISCTGDDADPDADADRAVADDTTAAPVAPATTEAAVATTANPDLEAAFEFAQCMRDHGIEDFADPQIRADGDFFLSPPADVGDEELNVADEACEQLLHWRTEAGTASNTSDVAAGWERIVPGGDCQCSDGSEFSFWVREASSDKVLFYLQDGGVCFSAETCAPDSDLFNTAVDQGPSGAGGIFDFADERNPFADYSVVYVPYCTGDAHLGNTTTEYAPGLTVHHNGYVNGTAALDHVAAAASGATEIVVVGESAGSLAAPLYAGLMSDRFPDARITVLADGSGSFPDVRRANEIISAWGFGNTIPPWPEDAGPTAEQWSFPGLFVQSGRHDPEIVFARHDYAYDQKQQGWYSIAGIPATDLLSLIDANETQIESAGVNLLSYVAPGDEHTALSDGTFYTEEVNGQPLVDWVTRLVEGEPVADVHCIDCTAG